MPTYLGNINDIVRTPVTLCTITLDYCTHVYGVSPCTGNRASGSECYNTWQTCHSKLTYSRLALAYSSSSAAFTAGETITGGTSGATAVVVADKESTNVLYLMSQVGTFVTETVTGSDSASTATITADSVSSDKTYKFSTQEAPLPIVGYRPYIEEVNHMPTEIKPNDITIKGRIKVKFADENDNDVDIDPYRSTRSSINGTFWKKLIARNPNYKGRRLTISEGFDDIAEVDFVPKFVGLIDNIKFNKSSMEIEAVDLLKALKDVKLPIKISSKLKNDLNATATSFGITSVTGLDSPSGYLRIDNEIISYSNINTTTRYVSGVTRALFNTKAEVEAIEVNGIDVDGHKQGAKVEKVKYYSATNPYTLLLSMLQTDAGIASSDINVSAFTTLAGDDPIEEIDRSAVITDEISLDKLVFELVNELDCKLWVNEDLKITIAKNIYNTPSQTYHVITDSANIVKDSTSIDLNEESRFTRITVYWNKDAIGDIEDKASYGRVDIMLDADAESDNEFREETENIFFSRWISNSIGISEEELSRYILNNFSRILFNVRDAQHIYDFEVEYKDMEINTGDFIYLSTSDFEETSGSDYSSRVFQVMRREKKEDGTIKLRAIATPIRKICFISDGEHLLYSSPSGNFRLTETITQGATTAIVASDDTTNNKLYLYEISGTFVAGTITGSMSGNTATISSGIVSAYPSYESATDNQKRWGFISGDNDLMADYLTYTSPSADFVSGETITGTGGATATVANDDTGNNKLYISEQIGNFIAGTITGGISGSTATISGNSTKTGIDGYRIF